jgi:Txe/YoeB family toxin of toxin-antitoxin system
LLGKPEIMPYKLYLSNYATEDWTFLGKENPIYTEQIHRVLALLKEDPLAPYPPYKKLTGELSGLFARKISGPHLIVYQIDEVNLVVKVISIRFR